MKFVDTKSSIVVVYILAKVMPTITLTTMIKRATFIEHLLLVKNFSLNYLKL